MGNRCFSDKTGKEIFTSKYAGTGDFADGFAMVSENNKYGFIDKTGKEITAMTYDCQ